MDDWTKLAPHLGISKIGVQSLKEQYPDTEEQKYRALLQWKSIDPKSATHKELIACLLAHASLQMIKEALEIITPG